VLFAVNPLVYRLLYNSMYLNTFIKAAHFPRHFSSPGMFSVLFEKGKSVSSVKWNSMYSLNTSAYREWPTRQAASHVLVLLSLLPFSHTHTHTHTHTSYISLSQTSFLGFFDELGTAAPSLSHISFKVSTLPTAALYHQGVLLGARTASYCHLKGASCTSLSIHMATQYLDKHTHTQNLPLHKRPLNG
jgi:hypothetical protein